MFCLRCITAYLFSWSWAMLEDMVLIKRTFYHVNVSTSTDTILFWVQCNIILRLKFGIFSWLYFVTYPLVNWFRKFWLFCVKFPAEMKLVRVMHSVVADRFIIFQCVIINSRKICLLKYFMIVVSKHANTRCKILLNCSNYYLVKHVVFKWSIFIDNYNNLSTNLFLWFTDSTVYEWCNFLLKIFT